MLDDAVTEVRNVSDEHLHDAAACDDCSAIETSPLLSRGKIHRVSALSFELTVTGRYCK